MSGDHNQHQKGSDPPPREWREPTSAEIKALWNATKKPSEFAALLLAKVKEKNT